MGAADLLNHLRESGFAMRIAGGKLLVAPATALTDADRAAIHQHRDSLLAALRPATTSERPYRLSVSGSDAAHRPAWDDDACARFTARVTRMVRLGIDATDADDLAERLQLRDVQIDDRVMCLECAHLRSGRCRNHKRAGCRRRTWAATWW